MSRHTTPRSLYNDIIAGDQFTCEDDLRAPIGVILKRVATVFSGGEERWKRMPAITAIDLVIDIIERLLFDSGEISLDEQIVRQRVYVQICDIKRQVEETLK